MLVNFNICVYLTKTGGQGIGGNQKSTCTFEILTENMRERESLLCKLRVYITNKKPFFIC